MECARKKLWCPGLGNPLHLLFPSSRGGKGFLAFYAPPGKALTGVFLDLTGASLHDRRSTVAQHPPARNASNFESQRHASVHVFVRFARVLVRLYTYTATRDKYNVASGRMKAAEENRDRQVGKSRIPRGPFGRGHHGD